ncbi:MAG: hypothetical protein WDM77_14410 [Steroidobacteraceae bacterium]
MGPAAALVVFAAMAWLLHRELEQIHVNDILDNLAAIPGRILAVGLALTAGSYLALCLYDFLALRYLHKKCRWAGSWSPASSPTPLATT